MTYKVLIIKNRFTEKVDKKYLDWFKDNTPLLIETTEIDTDFDLTFTNYGNDTARGVGLDEVSKDKFRTVVPRNKYHAVIVLYGNKAKGIRVSVTNYNPLFPETEFIQTSKNDSLTFNHELFHTFFYRLKRKGIFLQDPMDKVVVNGEVKHYFNNKNIKADISNRTIAMEMLKPYWNKVAEMGVISTILNAITPPVLVRKYKYFTDSEVVGLHPDLVALLDKARESAGIPFKINSGFRTEDKNEQVGGVKDSAHMKGLAVDIACTTSSDRYKIVQALSSVGFKRIGIAKTFVHADIDTTKPQAVIWLY